MPNLVLGWNVGEGLDPSYWTTQNPKLGAHKSSDLFQVPPAACAAHTAIIAQSGSGKSYFLGRLVEEIATQTSARCLILDPNADFRRFASVTDESLWSNPQYDLTQQRGRLPHETSRVEFLSKWQRVLITVRGGANSREAALTPVKVPWLSVSADFLAENLDAVDSTGVRNCHNFVRSVHDLLVLRSLSGQPGLTDYMSSAERLLRQAVATPQDFLATIREEWGLSGLSTVGGSDAIDVITTVLGITDFTHESVSKGMERRLTDTLTAARSIGETAKQFYFGKLGACRGTGVIADTLSLPQRSEMPSPQIDVIDLPSIDPSTRLLVVNAKLQAEWEAARASWEVALQRPSEDDTRVPLFIIIDEAHNLIPREPRNQAEAAIRDQFRTFVAEGRKYGVFVVVVTQRPDKVDPIVLSECENRAVMRLSSESTLTLTRTALGLEDVPLPLLSRCLAFPLGRALMIGPWSKHVPRAIYAAARRTVEGGRNLRQEHWARASGTHT